VTSCNNEEEKKEIEQNEFQEEMDKALLDHQDMTPPISKNTYSQELLENISCPDKRSFNKSVKSLNICRAFEPKRLIRSKKSNNESTNRLLRAIEG